MNRVPQSPWLERFAVFASVAAAVFGLAHGLSPMPGLTERLRDDAFYEFAWAANLAAGYGPSVSDGVATSGVQILWSLLLVPFAWVGGAACLPIVAPWLGLVLHFGSSLLWLLRGTDRVAALCVSLCWLGNPLLVRECQNGQETALACFLLVWLWQSRHATGRRFWLIAGLCVLARTDLFAIVFSLALWRHRQRPLFALRWPLALLAIMLVLYRCLGGGWLPDSAAPMAWLWHANFAATDPSTAQSMARHWWFLRPVLLGGPFAMASAMGIGLAVFSLVRPWWPNLLRALPALVVGCASALGARDLATPGWAALLIALLPVERRNGGVSRSLLALFAGSFAIVALHWGVRWYPRDYYAAPLVVLATVAVLRLGSLRVVLLVFALAQLADFRRVQPEPLRGQQEMQMGGRFLAEVLPRGERIGCFNSGIVTFEAAVLRRGTEREHRVLNLDGVVDARSQRALQAGELSAWLDAEGVRFVLDNPVQFASDVSLPHACGRWFGGGFSAERDLQEVARFDVPGVDNGRPGGDSFRLYWRRGHGEPPPPPKAPRDLGPGPRGGRYVLWPAPAGQWLEAEAAPGLHTPLLQVDVTTVVVLFVPAADLGTGRLFVRGNDRPVLVLSKL
jgi:hypothetical protein